MTETLLIKIVLPREPPSSSIFTRLAKTAWDMRNSAQSHQANQTVLDFVKLMERAVGRSVTATKKIYKNNYEKWLAETHWYVFVKRYISTAPHAAFGWDSAKELTWKKCNKLMWFTCGKYKEMPAQSRTSVVNEPGILVCVPMDRVTPVQDLTEDSERMASIQNWLPA